MPGTGDGKTLRRRTERENRRVSARLEKGEVLENLIPEAFAVDVRQVSASLVCVTSTFSYSAYGS